MKYESLLDVKRVKAEDLLAKLKDQSDHVSKQAGMSLVKDAANFGINLRDYLTLAVKAEDGLNGYETSLAYLNLPIRQDLAEGVVLQAASDTFQKYAGTRALFPEVIDDVLRWQGRQSEFETVAPLIAGSRTIAGNEMLSTIVEDDAAERATFSVPELARIPVRSIRTSQTAVTFFKHGSAIRTSYEFNRRASLDLLVPFARRVARELEQSKVAAATAVLVNGDGAYGAAAEVDQSSFNAATGVTATAGKICWENFLYWLVQRAKAGVPVDTLVMNWDSWFQYNMLFAKPEVTTQASPVTAVSVTAPPSEKLSKAGLELAQTAVSLNLRVTPVLSSAVAAGKFIGITRGETLEELVEAGSNIQESERSIGNQSVTLVKTETTGYKLAWGDTRQVYDYLEG